MPMKVTAPRSASLAKQQYFFADTVLEVCIESLTAFLELQQGIHGWKFFKRSYFSIGYQAGHTLSKI
jgi:hypothetical protein